MSINPNKHFKRFRVAEVILRSNCFIQKPLKQPDALFFRLNFILRKRIFFTIWWAEISKSRSFEWLKILKIIQLTK